MNKIKIEICYGTACYLLGAAKMLSIEEMIPDDCRDKVEIEAKTCLGLCERDDIGGAPYVRLNGTEIISKAEPELVIERIRELVEGVA
jgi:NADH:ubiquinone oxidoreductase subunit E